MLKIVFIIDFITNHIIHLCFQEYLEYQRQLHLQRLAQQELEMKSRLEQQRQMTLAREQLIQNPQLVNTFVLFNIRNTSEDGSHFRHRKKERKNIHN